MSSRVEAKNHKKSNKKFWTAQSKACRPGKYLADFLLRREKPKNTLHSAVYVNLMFIGVDPHPVSLEPLVKD